MTKIYIVTTDSACDYERAYKQEAFQYYGDAHKRMLEIFNEEKKYFPEDNVVEMSQDCVEIYEEGSYDENHLTVWIEDTELK